MSIHVLEDPCRKKRILFALIAACLGFLSVVGPNIVSSGVSERGIFYSLPAANGSGNFFASMALLFAVGFVLSIIAPSEWLFIAIAEIALLPFVAIVDMLIDPTSHNLFPVELLMYAAIDLPALLGAFLGGRIRGRGADSFRDNYLGPRT
jgi:hypothetical protein